MKTDEMDSQQYIDARRQLVEFNNWKREAAQKIEATACTIQALAKWLPFTDPADSKELLEHLVDNCEQISDLGKMLVNRYTEITGNEVLPAIAAEFEDDPPTAEGANGEPEGA